MHGEYKVKFPICISLLSMHSICPSKVSKDSVKATIFFIVLLSFYKNVSNSQEENTWYLYTENYFVSDY